MNILVFWFWLGALSNERKRDVWLDLELELKINCIKNLMHMVLLILFILLYWSKKPKHKGWDEGKVHNRWGWNWRYYSRWEEGEDLLIWDDEDEWSNVDIGDDEWSSNCPFGLWPYWFLVNFFGWGGFIA